MDVPIPNGSCELPFEKLTDLTTSTSLKSSLASMFRSSLTNPKFAKGLSISVHKSEELSIEIVDDKIDEFSEPKKVANFQKNYLDLGQWPEVQAKVFQKFKVKYWKMKADLNQCRVEKRKITEEVMKYKKTELPCRSCEVLKAQGKKTKVQLEEAMKLSNLMLRQLKEMDRSREFN